MTFSLRKDVKYHDGTAFDAESVKWNIDRYIRPGLGPPGARLGGSVSVVDPATVASTLKTLPALANLVDRAGMMVQAGRGLARTYAQAFGRDRSSSLRRSRTTT